jgi:hypothetical protein
MGSIPDVIGIFQWLNPCGLVTTSSHSHKIFLSKIQRMEWSTQQSALALTNHRHEIVNKGIQHLIQVLHFHFELI